MIESVSWIPIAVYLLRLSLCKVSPWEFRSKTWEVLSTKVAMPNLQCELRVTQEDRASSISLARSDSAGTLLSICLPTKVDLHVHGITCHPKKRTRKIRNSAVFPGMFLQASDRFSEIGSAQADFHMVGPGCPDWRVSPKLCDMFP